MLRRAKNRFLLEDHVGSALALHLALSATLAVRSLILTARALRSSDQKRRTQPGTDVYPNPHVRCSASLYMGALRRKVCAADVSTSLPSLTLTASISSMRLTTVHSTAVREYWTVEQDHFTTSDYSSDRQRLSSPADSLHTTPPKSWTSKRRKMSTG